MVNVNVMYQYQVIVFLNVHVLQISNRPLQMASWLMYDNSCKLYRVDICLVINSNKSISNK